MGDISKNFSYSEFEKSETAKKYGIDNTIPAQFKAPIEALVLYIVQPARDYMGVPVRISSGFRALALNPKIKGSSKTSQHCKGEAADLKCADNAKLFNFIRENLPFDQLIWEYGNDAQPQWVHVSFVTHRLNRGEILRKYSGPRGYVHLNQ